MTIDKISNISPPPKADVTLKVCGNAAEIKYVQCENRKPRIEKLSKDEYVVLGTGEVKSFQHNENRLDDRQSLRESLSRLRDYLNANVTDVSKARWVTLTYKENMSDPVQLYADFKAFNRRCRRQYGHYEYIVAAEYQKRGALHLHCVFVFDKRAPFMDGDNVAKLWRVGFVKIRRLKSVTDIGRYITAYCGDVIVNEPGDLPDGVRPEQLRVVEVEENGVKVSKMVAKRARLAMMPPGFNLYRISRGIKPPSVSRMTCAEAESQLCDWKQTYQRTYRLTDESRNFENIVSTVYFQRSGCLSEKELLQVATQETLSEND